VYAIAESLFEGVSMHFLGQGSYGTAFISYGRETANAWKRITNGPVKSVINAASIPNEAVVVKVQLVKRGDDASLRRQLREFHRESRGMVAVKNAPPVTIGGTTFYAGDKVPTLYAAAYLPSHGVFVFVMSLAPGKDVCDVDKITATQYVAMEHAILSFWLTGYAHGDLHDCNVRMDRNRITFIDFGRVIPIPPRYMDLLRAILQRCSLDPIREFWHTFGKYVDGVQRQRGFPAYWPNADLVYGEEIDMVNRLSVDNLLHLEEARRKSWKKCATAPQKTLTRAPAGLRNGRIGKRKRKSSTTPKKRNVKRQKTRKSSSVR
jgi:tRNA A-37 threonylcarbamoyl transferase component Bud32